MAARLQICRFAMHHPEGPSGELPTHCRGAQPWGAAVDPPTFTFTITGTDAASATGTIGSVSSIDKCYRVASTCSEPGTAPRIINDHPVARACWQRPSAPGS